MSAYVGYHVWIYMFLLIVVASATVWHHRYGGRSEGSEAEDVTCDPPWQLLHRSCVQFFKVKPFSTWQDARNVCAQNKAELLCINDKAEKDNVRPLLQEHVKSIDLLNWWVGLSLSANGTWYWVDGQELNKYLIDWAPQSGKTLDDNGEILQNRCGMLNYQGRLTDEDCGQTKPFICEQNPTRTTISTKSVTETSSGAPVTLPSTTNATSRGQTTETSLTTEAFVTKSDNQSSKPAVNTTVMTSSTTSPTTVKENGKTTDKVTGDPTDKVTSKPTEKETGKPSKGPDESTDNVTDLTTNKWTGKPTDESTNNQTEKHTTQSSESTATPKPQKSDKDEFLGCYTVNLESTCPPVEAFGISWPRTEPGKMVFVPCDKGQAKWKCDKNPTCWKGEADVKQCTSEKVQDLTNQLEQVLADPEDSQKAIEFTENLAASAGPGTVLSEQDMYQSTKLMTAAAQTRPKNSTEAKNIIQNVAKCGSNLVGSDKKSTWSSMSRESQRTVASSLLNSMETVTRQMLNTYNAPTVETITEENMAIELQVVNVSDTGPDPKPVEYEGNSNVFSIPLENLKRFSAGGLARLVFISYNNIGQVLVPEDDVADDAIDTRTVSQVVSASIGEKPVDEPLSHPITFTMNTEERAKNQEWKQLCSFWNFSLGYTGAWSQRGCSLKKYNSSHTTCECDHLTNFAILMDIHSTKLAPVHATALSYITYVGIIISIVCLFLSWVTFVCLSSAQGERNSIHKNLVFCLFVAEILFLAGIERTNNKIACAVIAGVLHFFFMAGFTWMFVEGVHILFMLVQVFDAAKSRLKYYYLIGYGVPLIICGVSALVYYEGYGTQRYCWLTNERMFIWSFAGPVAFILLVNLMILIYAMSAVCKHSEYVFTKEKSKAGNIKAWIQGALALEVLLGLTWVFGYFYINEEALVMAYLFTIFNSLQGLFIFIFHCILNKKVRKEYQRFISYPRRPVSSTHSSSKGFHHTNGSGPQTASYSMTGGRKSSGFVDLAKERRQSAKSTTSA